MGACGIVEESLTVGIGVGATTCDLALDLGELHPSGHGALRLDLRTANGTVTWADPRPGLLHRGTEKLLEARDYRQALMLIDRHDWLSAVTSEIALALAVEELIGLEVPPRAVWLRTALAEMSRLMAALMHLAGAATLPPRGLAALDAPGMRAREELQARMEEISGGRMHAMITRVGGLAADTPPGWSDRVLASLDVVRDDLDSLSAVLPEVIGDPGIAILSRDQAIDFAVSGPVARASALDIDVRRDHPYLAYADLSDVLRVELDDRGDALARYDVLRRQALADLVVLAACIERMPDGPVDVPLPKVVRAPEGEAYARVESATGINGVYLVSTGAPTPWRVRLRTASYANVQAMSAALPGTRITDLACAVSSFCFVAGDIDH